MQLLSIETTPSPNCIKLNLDGAISAKSLTLDKGSDLTDTPEVIQQLLTIEGVKSVFAVQDFITLTRQGSSDWQPILAKAAKAIGVADNADAKLLTQVAEPAKPVENEAPGSNLGMVEVAVQMFRGIPVQVKATAADGQQARISLSDRFSQALQRA
ncbi:MAG: virulence factor, partial [Cyanobacteria bacterium P01_C01_bin.118]